MNSSVPQFLDLRTAARLLCISERSLWGLATEGKIPAFRVGKLWRFSADELSAWAADASKANVSLANSHQANR